MVCSIVSKWGCNLDKRGFDFVFEESCLDSSATWRDLNFDGIIAVGDNFAHKEEEDTRCQSNDEREPSLIGGQHCSLESVCSLENNTAQRLDTLVDKKKAVGNSQE